MKVLKPFLILSIVIVTISVTYSFVIHCFFPEWKDSGVFGDSFGAINSVFSGLALAGIIVTILVQRHEIKETQNQYLINRLTELIYNQLNRFEQAVENFSIDYDGIYRGNRAFIYLDTIIQKGHYPTDAKLDEKTLIEIKSAITSNMQIFSKNQQEILCFSLSAYNSIKVVMESIIRSDLSPSKLDELKNIFFRNIGFIHLGVMKEMNEVPRKYLKLCSEDISLKVDDDELFRSTIFLEPIVKFRETIITKEIIQTYRENIKNEFGAYA